jgi:hypothetical protein
MATGDRKRRLSDELEADDLDDQDDFPKLKRVDPDEQDDPTERRRARQERDRKRMEKKRMRRRRRDDEDLF